MKNLLAISFLVFCITASYAQPQPAILSIEGFGGEKHDQLNKVVVRTQDGGFILSINTSSNSGNINTNCTNGGNANVFRKYNVDASVIEWEKCIHNIPDSAFLYLFPNAIGEFIMGGAKTAPGNRTLIIRKQDDLGSIYWSSYYGGSYDDFLVSMAESSDGGYFMLSKTNSDDGDVGLHYGGFFTFDTWVLKLDANGNLLWSKVIGGSMDEKPQQVIAAPDGGCYLVGATESNDHDCIGHHGVQDVMITRIDGAGNIKWNKCLGGSGDDFGFGGTLSGNGGLVVAAYTNSSDGDVQGHIGGYDLWLLEMDSNGNVVWSKCHGYANSRDQPNAVCMATDGTIWAGGTSADDIWIVHTDATGNLLSDRRLGTAKPDVITMLTPLPGGIVFAGGHYEASGIKGSDFPLDWHDYLDIFLARFAPWTTTVQSTNPSANISSVYPNPATDHVVFGHNVSTPVKNLQLTVTNMTGQVVKKFEFQNIAGESWWDTRTVPAGVYIYKLSDAGRQVDVGKVVITR